MRALILLLPLSGCAALEPVYDVSSVASICVAIIALLQIADGWTTYRILSRGGVEKNPVVRRFIDALGLVPGLVVVKGGVIALLVLLVNLDVGGFGAARDGALILLAALYAWVVRHNLIQLVK